MPAAITAGRAGWAASFPGKAVGAAALGCGGPLFAAAIAGTGVFGGGGFRLGAALAAATAGGWGAGNGPSWIICGPRLRTGVSSLR